MEVIEILESNKINRDVVIGVRMTKSEADLIDKLALKDDRSRAGYLHSIITSYLKEVSDL